jgi:hypothetical protein
MQAVGITANEQDFGSGFCGMKGTKQILGTPFASSVRWNINDVCGKCAIV